MAKEEQVAELLSMLQELVDHAPESKWVRNQYGDPMDDNSEWDSLVKKAESALEKHKLG